jgi:hypothetical protein
VKKKRKNKSLKDLQRGYTASRGGLQTKMLAMSLTNPWEFAGCIPDGARGVGCYSIKQEFTFATGATGTCNALAWNPNLGGQALFYSDSLSTANTPTISGNWASASALNTINLLYAKSRPISAGIRVSYIGNTNTDGGILLTGVVSGGVPLSSFAGISATGASALLKTYKITPLRNGSQSLWLPDDEMDMANFTTFSGSLIGVTNTFQAPYLVVLLYNANSGVSTMQAECIANFEGQYENSTFNPGGLTDNAPPAEAGWYTSIQNFARGVQQVVPLIGEFANSSAGRTLGSAMANGYLYRARLANTALPRLM